MKFERWWGECERIKNGLRSQQTNERMGRGSRGWLVCCGCTVCVYICICVARERWQQSQIEYIYLIWSDQIRYDRIRSDQLNEIRSWKIGFSRPNNFATNYLNIRGSKNHTYDYNFHPTSHHPCHTISCHTSDKMVKSLKVRGGEGVGLGGRRGAHCCGFYRMGVFKGFQGFSISGFRRFRVFQFRVSRVLWKKVRVKRR